MAFDIDKVKKMITISDTEFVQIAKLIHSNYGIYLKNEKKSLLMSRLQNELLKNNFISFSQYFEYLVKDDTGAAANDLINKITTNHTYFLREKNHFDYFSQKVLKCLAENNKNEEIRIWSAGCSSGEEPYTLAMLIKDYENQNIAWSNARILATDISERVLNKAKNAMYTNENISVLPSVWKLNYLTKADKDNSKFKDNITQKIVFKRFNLMDNFPFKKKFHTIFCKNVMIYFNKSTRDELIHKFYEVTEPGGFLFIGQSESISKHDSGFKYIMPSVYRKV